MTNEQQHTTTTTTYNKQTNKQTNLQFDVSYCIYLHKHRPLSEHVLWDDMRIGTNMLKMEVLKFAAENALELYLDCMIENRFWQHFNYFIINFYFINKFNSMIAFVIGYALSLWHYLIQYNKLASNYIVFLGILP